MVKVTEVQQVNDDLRRLVEYDNEVISGLLRRFGDTLPKKKYRKQTEAPTSEDIDEYIYRTLTVLKRKEGEHNG